jgi:cell division protein FtsB
MSGDIKKYLTLNNTVLIAALVLAGSWAIGSIGTLNHNYDLQRQVDQARLDNQLIELQNQNLRLEQAYFQTNEFLDLQARALLGKANPGEHLVLLPRIASSPEQNNNSTPTETPTKSNLNQWTDFLFGRRE